MVDLQKGINTQKTLDLNIKKKPSHFDELKSSSTYDFYNRRM